MSRAVVPEGFQPVAWRHTQVVEIRRTVEHLQFGKRLFRDGCETPVSSLHPKLLRVLATEIYDHGSKCIVWRYDCYQFFHCFIEQAIPQRWSVNMTSMLLNIREFPLLAIKAVMIPSPREALGVFSRKHHQRNLAAVFSTVVLLGQHLGGDIRKYSIPS